MKHLLVVAGLVACVPAIAEPLKSAPKSLDPSKAYVLVEARNLDLPKRPAEFMMAVYDAASHDLLGAPVTTTTRDGNRITETTTRSLIVRETFGAKALVKDGTRRLYLAAVAPGLWTIEGASAFAPPLGNQLTSFSLGAPTIRLAAGTITDLGVADVGGDWIENQSPKTKISVGDMLKMSMLGSIGTKRADPVAAKIMFHPRTTTDLAVPADLRMFPIAAAEWGASVEFGNHLGGLVNRMGGRASRETSTQ